MDAEPEEMDLGEEVEEPGPLEISIDLASTDDSGKEEPKDEPKTKEKPVAKPADIDLPEDFQLK